MDCRLKLNGQRIRQMRKNLGLTREALASNADLEPRTVADIELGHRPGKRPVNPRASTVKAIADALGTTVQSLYGASIYECHTDFNEWAEKTPRDALSISAIAIDLTVGWDVIRATINSCGVRPISFRVLALGGEISDAAIPEHSIVTEMWLKASEASVSHIKSSISTTLADGGDISFELRTYGRIPTIHGTKAEMGDQTRWWITECSRVGSVVNTYDWGHERYSIHDTEDETTAAFEELFDRLWKSSSKHVIKINGDAR